MEAALAGAEPLLTPPRSSPESPDRSSSPESESGLMLGRDIMSLPIRKRKLYLRDDEDEMAAAAAAAVEAQRKTVSGGDLSQGQRISSVIQFARAQ